MSKTKVLYLCDGKIIDPKRLSCFKITCIDEYLIKENGHGYIGTVTPFYDDNNNLRVRYHFCYGYYEDFSYCNYKGVKVYTNDKGSYFTVKGTRFYIDFDRPAPHLMVNRKHH